MRLQMVCPGHPDRIPEKIDLLNELSGYQVLFDVVHVETG
jgi:hypothetical protein